MISGSLSPPLTPVRRQFEFTENSLGPIVVIGGGDYVAGTLAGSGHACQALSDKRSHAAPPADVDCALVEGADLIHRCGWILRDDVGSNQTRISQRS